MAITVDIDFKGAASLDRAFRDLSGPKQKKATRKGLRAGAKVIADRARELVPTLSEKLLRTIKVRAAKRSRSSMGVNVVAGDKETFAGVEFGTANQPPQPFFRPAFDQLEGQAAELVREEIGIEVEKIWRAKP